MSGGFVGRREENVYLSPLVLEITDCLQWAFELLNAGQEERILSDPFYTRSDGLPPLTEADVDRVIAALDAEYDAEMRGARSHHLQRSGATERTEIHRLSPRARRALVERIDAIFTKHQGIDQTEPRREPPSLPEDRPPWMGEGPE
jgi:hypothetical protein